MNHIEIKNLKVCYIDKRIKEAVRGLNLTVSEGHIYGFLGPNRAGKSTAIKTMIGLIPEYESQ